MKLKYLYVACLGLIGLASCVTVDETLGQDYLATEQQYEVYSAEFPLEDIRMDYPEELSSYSNYRFIVGAIREELFGLTTRSTTFTLVPVVEEMDFGIEGTQVFKQFHFSAPIDTLSYLNENQLHIFQNINVYEVEEYVDLTEQVPTVKHGSTRITKGVPVYDGADSLAFDFTQEFAEKYMQIKTEDLDSLATYSQKFPGIYMDTDAPAGEGGRINMFSLPLDVAEGYINGAYAVLKFSAEYEDLGQVDTSFYFTLGPLDMYDYTDVTSTTVDDYPQAAYNISTSESSPMKGQAGEDYYYEGGKGLKPVITAETIRNLMIEEVSQHGDPQDIIISKASIVLPFVFPDNYEDMTFYPTTLSPTCRIVYDDGTVLFASITDSSVSSENQGEVNRSTCVYSPDITHHAQEMLRLEDESKISNYDIWFLALAEEDTTSAASEAEASESLSSALESLSYSQYYSTMYGSGSSSSYSNYYYYYYYASMLSSSYTGEESETLLDLGRFYKAKFVGPSASENTPTFSITYAVPLKD